MIGEANPITQAMSATGDNSHEVANEQAKKTAKLQEYVKNLQETSPTFKKAMESAIIKGVKFELAKKEMLFLAQYIIMEPRHIIIQKTLFI